MGVSYANMIPAGPAPTTHTSHFLKGSSMIFAGTMPLVLVTVILIEGYLVLLWFVDRY